MWSKLFLFIYQRVLWLYYGEKMDKKILSFRKFVKSLALINNETNPGDVIKLHIFIFMMSALD